MSTQAVRLTNVDIDNALNNAHLDIVFQPIVLLSDRQVLRREVFVRWNHPGLGPLPPGAFIAFFEAQGRIGELTRYVLRQAIAAYTALGDDVSGGLSINLSLADLADDELPATIVQALEGTTLSPSDLVLECPGFSPTLTTDVQMAQYARLAAIGCPLSLEIRTRTTETIAALAPFPFAEIKTGGSRILRYARSSRSGPGLSAIAELVDFAKDHGVRTVAVGIEDDATAKALASIGFDAGQGRALGRAEKLGSSDDKPACPEQTTPSEIAEPVSAETHPITATADPVDQSSPQERNDIQARQAAAKRMATRRFHAAKNARQLQWRLEASMNNAEQSEPTPRKQVLVEDAPETVNTTDVSDAPAPNHSNVTSLVDNLPTNIIVRARTTVNLTMGDGVQPSDDNAEIKQKNTEDTTVSATPDIDEKNAPYVEQVTFVVTNNTSQPVMPRWLRRKYRITHFWPRSWTRARTKTAAPSADQPAIG